MVRPEEVADFRQYDVRVGDGSSHLHVIDHGVGTPVVFVHGSPTNSALWRHVIGALSPSRRCIAPDLLGFGVSSAPEDGAGFKELVDTLRDALQQIVVGRFSLVVHDWGGPVGVAACADRLDDIDRLILLNTTVRPSFRPPSGWEPFIDPGTGETFIVEQNVWCTGLPGVMHAANDAAIHAQYLAPSERLGTRRTILRLERLEGFVETLSPAFDRLITLSLPTLIAWGTDDIYFRNEYEVLRNVLPNAEFVALPGGGHFPQEDAPDATTACIVAFLS